ncbi:MAG: hypothetical protein R3A44_10745 [Caldilineaceae bacterium]
MFALSSILIAGGLAYTGSVAYKQLRRFGAQLGTVRGHSPVQHMTEHAEGRAEIVQSLANANRSLSLATVSLGLTVAGIIFNSLLIIVSVPAALLIFAPALQDAWRTLRQDRRITPAVLDATRVILCIVMGYYFALALDTWLRTLTQRLMVITEVDFQEALAQSLPAAPASVWRYTAGADVATPLAELAVGDILHFEAGEFVPVAGIVRNGLAWLDERLATGNLQAVRKIVGDPVLASTYVTRGDIHVEITAIPESTGGTAAVRARIEKMIRSGNHLADIGIQSGRRMAPSMWATFALLLPFWDANRAAGFLTTSFGNQMERLGPYTLRNFARFALQQQTLIYDGHVLETLNLVNTIVIEAALVHDPVIRKQIRATLADLRQRRWLMQRATFQHITIYLLADGDEMATQALADEVGFDGCFVEPLAIARAALLERMQRGGRLICYVGSGADEAIVMDKALVSVVIPSVGAQPLKLFESTGADVVIVEKDLRRLVQLFDIAAHFGASQGVNLAWPLLMDLMDIFTTVFVHLGLTYSILFSYSGLLGSALYARLPLARRRKRRRQAGKPVDPDRQIGDSAYSS